MPSKSPAVRPVPAIERYDGPAFRVLRRFRENARITGERAPALLVISAKHGLKWQAVVDKKNRSFALAIVGQFPDVDGVQKAVRESLEEEQKSFPVDILVQEGNRWLSLDFMAPDDAKFLESGSVK